MKNQFTPLYRIWHWTMALSVIGLLCTVLLRKTFLSYKTNALIIQEKLAALDVEITLESAKTIAKAIRAPMWEWHYIFAAILGISILLRLVLLFTKEAKHPVVQFLEAPKEEKLKKGVHVLLCLCIALLALSGAILYFHETLGLEKASIGWVKESHEFLMFPLIGTIVLHLGGVLMHEIKTKEPIVSKMIHGDA
jgi:cytochrome b561